MPRKDTFLRLLAYLGRWQMSSPILALAIAFVPGGTATKVIVANFIGGLIFFPVDRFIMTSNKKNEQTLETSRHPQPPVTLGEADTVQMDGAKPSL